MAVFFNQTQQNHKRSSFIKALAAGAFFFVSSAYAASVTIETARGPASIQQNPAKIAVYDMGALDTLDALGVAVGASTDKQHLDYLQKATQSATTVGTLFEPDIEALRTWQPDLVIIGTRSAPKYDELKKIFANTIDMTARNGHVFEDSLQRLADYGKLFGKTEQADAIQKKLTQLIEDTQKLSQNKGTGLILIVSGDKVSAQGPESRLGWIHNDLHIAEADKNIKPGKRGQPVTFEYISKIDPDWLFVLDRSASIGEAGVAAATTLENILTQKTRAWQKGQVVYISGASYIAPGGVRQIETDLNAIKKAFENTP